MCVRPPPYPSQLWMLLVRVQGSCSLLCDVEMITTIVCLFHSSHSCIIRYVVHVSTSFVSSGVYCYVDCLHGTLQLAMSALQEALAAENVPEALIKQLEDGGWTKDSFADLRKFCHNRLTSLQSDLCETLSLLGKALTE